MYEQGNEVFAKGEGAVDQYQQPQPVTYSPAWSSSSTNYQNWYNYYQTSSPYNYYSSYNYYSTQDYSAYSNPDQPSEIDTSGSALANSSISQYLTTSSSTSETPSSASTNFSYDASVSSIAEQSYPIYSSPISDSSRQESNRPRVESAAARFSRKHQLPDRAVEIMNEWFDEHQSNPYPQLCEKEKMAQLGGITVKQVTAWFSNRRNRSQNTKPKRIKRVLESKLNEICQELAYNPGSAQLAEKFEHIRSTLENRY